MKDVVESVKRSRPQFQIDPENLPMPRPGAYLIRNLVNGKCYVGISQNVQKRLKEHAGGWGQSPVLLKAIKKYGASSFRADPILYSLSGTDWLPVAEAELIVAWNSLEHGYNVLAASGGVGPYGPKMRAILRASHARPEVKAKMQASSRAFAASEDGKLHYQGVRERMTGRVVSAETRAKQSEIRRRISTTPEARAAASAKFKELHTRPEFVERLSASMRASRSTPESKARQRAAAKKRWEDPDMRTRHSANSRAAKSTPEYKAALGLRTREIMARPEVKAKRIASLKATFANPDLRARLSANAAEFRWITNGIVNVRTKIDGPLQEGWRFGRVGNKGRPRKKPKQLTMFTD